MQFQLITKRSVFLSFLLKGLWLLAIEAALLSMLDWMQYFVWILPGVAVCTLLGLFSKRNQRIIACAVAACCVILMIVRWPAAMDGFRILANRLFALSEATQSYEYTYFQAFGTSPVEALVYSGIILGTVCAVSKKWGNLVLTALLALTVAFFGVAPKPLYLALLVLAAAANGSLRQGGWLNTVVVTILIAAIAFTVFTAAPEENPVISQWDEQLRDTLASTTLFYEHKPQPVPEPDVIPPPPETPQQPNHGVTKEGFINVLMIVLIVITALMLFVPAIIRDAAAKKAQKNRAGMYDEDHAAAIREMYLYARKWRALEETPAAVPEDIYELWLEAAFSEHTLCETHRKKMLDYVKQTAQQIWECSSRRKRFLIRYKYAL